MPKPWRPEFPVDAALAARLAAKLVPEVAGVAPERVGEGWDNDVWRFGAWTFRFPRRTLGAELIRFEARVLPALAPHLPIAVPAAERVAEPGPDHPAPYIAHRYVPGTTLDRARLDDAGRRRLAPQIAAFVKALHAIPRRIALDAGAPRDSAKRDVEKRRAMIRERLPRLAGTRYAHHMAPIAALCDAIPPAGDAIPGPARSVCHGDLYPRHLLVDPAGDLCGAIDWGDVMISHPGIDLSIAYTLLPAATRPAFWAVYGTVDDGTRALARVTAAHYGVALALYALDVGDAPLADEAEHNLRNAVA